MTNREIDECLAEYMGWPIVAYDDFILSDEKYLLRGPRPDGWYLLYSDGSGEIWSPTTDPALVWKYIVPMMRGKGYRLDLGDSVSGEAIAKWWKPGTYPPACTRVIGRWGTESRLICEAAAEALRKAEANA